LSLPKISSEREFEQLQELITELGREVNRRDLTIGKLPPQSRSQELLSRDPQTVGTAAAQHWRTGNGTDQAARRS
jgi:hypothetical protein